MTDVGIRCMTLARGANWKAPVGQWLKSYDPEAFKGRGTAEWTDNPSEAMRFPSAIEAMRCWQQTSRTRPLRGDGKPNRPLTAFSIEVLAIPQERA